MNITSLLNQIVNNEIVLPAIQRNFVWAESKIEKLMDSILRGYPIGIVLMWETYTDIQYRKFSSKYVPSHKPNYSDNLENRRLKLVLDGQQRLQSLYLALYGQYNGKFLYFDILSGRESDDFEEEKFWFYFGTEKEAKEWNADALEDVESQPDDYSKKEYFYKVADLFKLSPSEKLQCKKTIVKEFRLDDDDELRLDKNISQLDYVLTKDSNILKVSTIDENKAHDSKERQTESDVLEIFVRINRQGTPLSRSDLIFSMLKLSWKDSATVLPDFVEEINEGNSFAIDMDFVIRCLFAVSDLGTKFNIDLLRKKSNLKKMQDNFEQCCSAIRACVDSVQKHCWVSSNKAFGGTVNLVPFVYYLYHSPKHLIQNDQIENFRKAFFLFAFSGVFSRYADSRLENFIKNDLRPLQQQKDYSFPLIAAVKKVHYWGRISGFNEELVQLNHKLALHIIQNDTGNKTHLVLNSREIDHIFPKSTLRDKGFEVAKINHFANYWILGKGKNINKTNKHPNQYFYDVSDKVLAGALIDREMLDYRRYNTFLKKRSAAIVTKLSKKIGFSDQDFTVLRD